MIFVSMFYRIVIYVDNSTDPSNKFNSMRLVFNLTIQVDDLYLFCNRIVIKKKMFGSIYEGFYHY